MFDKLTTHERTMVDFIYQELEEVNRHIERHTANLDDRQPVNPAYSNAMLDKWKNEHVKLSGQLDVFKKLDADRTNIGITL